MAAGALSTHAAEHVTLRNGFDLVCDHRAATGDRVRLYLTASGGDFMEVAASEIIGAEAVPEMAGAGLEAGNAPPATQPAREGSPVGAPDGVLTAAQVRQMAARAGAAHDLDVELLASVVHAESGGRVRAVSRTGARGLMQLMPATADDLGVSDSFRAEQNLEGGTAYLDALLRRYNENLAMALAAYNAGPAAVDRYHGIPPYRETQRYVARIIHDFNRRKAALQPAMLARVGPAQTR